MGYSIASERHTIASCNIFYRFVPCTKMYFFPIWLSSFGKKTHKLAEQTVSLACSIVLQPTHMLKREGGLKWLHDYRAGYHTMSKIYIQWWMDSFCVQKDLGGKRNRGTRFPTRPRAQGPVWAEFSFPVSRTGLRSLFLWCRLYGAVSSERALCAHDVCVGTDFTFPSNQCGGGGKQDEKKGRRRREEALQWLKQMEMLSLTPHSSWI